VSDERVARLRSLIARLAQLAACNDIGSITERERLCQEIGKLSRGGIPPNVGLDLLILPCFHVVGYNGQGQPVTGVPGKMHPPTPEEVREARAKLAEYSGLCVALARWIMAAEGVGGD